MQYTRTDLVIVMSLLHFDYTVSENDFNMPP